MAQFPVPRTRLHELAALAQEHDGLLTAAQARKAGISGSVLARLTQRGRLVRAARGVYRIPFFPSGPLSQYQEAILWAKASHGPQPVALSHDTAFAVYGVTDANPSAVHITVPHHARLRRQRPKWVTIHHGELKPGDVIIHEGLPVTTIGRTVVDVLTSTGRIEQVRRAVIEARREGFLSAAEARRLRRQIDAHTKNLIGKSRSTGRVT